MLAFLETDSGRARRSAPCLTASGIAPGDVTITTNAVWHSEWILPAPLIDGKYPVAVPPTSVAAVKISAQ
jgi:hypothetical protein